jgi:hypothetical protein
MLSALLFASWLMAPAQATDPDPGASGSAAAGAALEQIDAYAPTAPDPPTAAAGSQPDTAATAGEPAADQVPASPPAPTSAGATSAAASTAPDAETDDEDNPAPQPCPTAERSRYTMYGGLGAGAVGVVGALVFFTIGQVERMRAQDLLDNSPAFGEQDDHYVVRDANHEDVAAYDSHRAAASVMSQLVWVSLGVGAVGAAVSAVSFWLGDDASRCQAAVDP